MLSIPVVRGTKTMSSWLYWAIVPLRSITPITLKATLLIVILCPTGSTPLSKRWSTTSDPNTATLVWSASSVSL